MNGTPLSSILLIFLAAIIGSVGAVYLKIGAARLRYGFFQNIFNVKLALGVALFLGSSVFYLLGIRHGELTVLFPMVSIGYVFGLFWSKLFFGEPFTKAKILGLALILVGVVFVGLGKQ